LEFEIEVVSPRAAALRILATRYGLSEVNAMSNTYSLAAFQQEAVTRAIAIMRERGGVILADSVGLGKTFIAAALIEVALRADQQCVVAVPAATRTMWNRELRPLIEHHPNAVTVVSHGQLSRGLVIAPGGLVVVDEAHAFRSPHTRRYHALRHSCAGSRVLLLTATPVNNSLSDLYFQLRLFAADNAFRDLGLGSLAGLLKSPDTDPDAQQRLRRAVVIRRTRTDLRARFQQIELPSGRQLRFPREVKLQIVGYPFGASVQEVAALLSRIRFAAHGDDVTPILLRLSLLKRMQSGQHAFATSIDRLLAFYDRYLSSLASGRVLKPRLLRDVAGEQLVLAELLVEESFAVLPLDDMRRHAEDDRTTLRLLRGLISRTGDGKLDRLKELLDRRRHAKTVVFTEYVDTAEHLWQRLQRDFRLGMVTGTSAFLGANRSNRLDVIRRFAPRSNAAADPPSHEAVDVLIATDVLAEGLNLQDADAVVSYDLPWNPVRLIQRAGRVDRIGSSHDVVRVYNFLPDREFDVFIGLVRTLRSKLMHVRQTVGQESAVLEPDELDLDFVAALQTGHPDLLREEPIEHRFREAKADLSYAAPIGCVAALPNAGGRVLVCMQRGSLVRELIVTANSIISDASLTDVVLEDALLHDVTSAFTNEGALTRACDYLEREFANARDEGRETRMLAREIRNAVQRLGVFITDAALQKADLTLQMLPGFFGNQRTNCAQLRAVVTETQLLSALQGIGNVCTPISEHNGLALRLVAAIAAG
jgi:superfamily II DNA or RNA helicase